MTKNCNELKRANKPNELMRTMSPMGLVRSMSLMSSILLIALLFALSSCSKGSDEDPVEQPTTTVQPEETPICFAGNMPEPTDVTRAASLSSTGQTSFTVWGYKNMSYDAGTGYGETQCVFPSYVVNWTSNSAGTTTSNSSGWEYVAQTPNQTIKFWDWSAKAYRFFAVTGWTGLTPPATYEANKTYVAGENAVSMLADASSTDAMDETPYFSHLWFSTGDPVAYADKQFGRPVVLEFLKPYARVRFIFKYVYPREGIKLTEIKFKPSDGSSKIVRKGTVTVSYPIQGTATSETFTTTPGDAAKQLDYFSEDYDPEDDTKVYSQTNNGWYMVLPNNTQGSYTMSVRVNNSDPAKTAVVPANYMQWLPGYSYTYIFKITEEGGVEIGWVESAVTPWNEMVASWTVYNW